MREVLPASRLGEFSLQPQQGDVRAAFVPLARLQQDLDLGDRVNALLVSGKAGGAGDGVVPAGLPPHAATRTHTQRRFRIRRAEARVTLRLPIRVV